MEKLISKNMLHLLSVSIIVLVVLIINSVGSDVQEFIFTKPGRINVRIENVGDNKHRF